MVDWEDPFDLAALCSRTKGEDGEESGQRRVLAMLQGRGMMELELEPEAVGDDDYPDAPAVSTGGGEDC